MHCKKLAIFVLLILLAGCQAGASLNYLSAAYEQVRPGTNLQLNKPLTIPVNLARVYLQAGSVVTENSVDRYYPNCSLEVKTLNSSSQKILDDVFKIIKIQYEEETSGLYHIYASNLLRAGDGGVSYENWVIHFYLQSAKQPDVFRLSCAHWEDPTEARHLTLTEIKAALGDYFSLLP